MTLALIDCPTGLAGNMLLAALLDLGLPEEVVHRPLEALGLGGCYRLVVEESRSGGLRGLHLQVCSLESEPPHRHWRELRSQLVEAPLDARLRERVLMVFGLLAEAEAAVHGQAPEAVHFHEVGALDALVDIVGVCAGLQHFGVERLVCGVPPAGHGTVRTAHGLLPLPAPAVLEIARRRAIPLGGSEGFPPAELTTPTGLALAACWAERFAPPPSVLPERVGVGLGSRQLDRPNLLRLTLATPWPPSAPDASGPGAIPASSPPEAMAPEELEVVVQQQGLIDDASGEDLAFLVEALRQGGALEVYGQSVAMKKGRPGTLVTVLAPREQAEALRRIWWRQSTTLGLREHPQPRWVLPREVRRVTTPLGEVGLKRVALPGGGARVKIEHDDLVGLAERHALSLAEVRRSVEQALRDAGDPWVALPAAAPATPPLDPPSPQMP